MAPDLAPNCFNVCHQKRLAGKVLHVYNPVKCTEYEMWERSGSVVECLTRDRRAAGSSLTGVTALWSLSKTHLS